MRNFYNLNFMIAVVVAMLVSFAGRAEERMIAVCGPDGEAVEGATLTWFDAALDSVGVSVSSASGVAVVEMPPAVKVLVEHPGYSSRLAEIAVAGADTVRLDDGLTLGEVTVGGETMERGLTHRTYRIPLRAMQKYPTFMQALNEIPSVTVLTSGTLFMDGHENVKLLLNGVETSVQELSTIAKEDVARVKVYDTPPARFAMQGYSAVIDVQLKSEITGGNVGVDISQAFHPLKGNNSVAVYYNYNRSKFSLLYNNENKHYRKYSQTETLAYEVGGEKFGKEKIGVDSPSDSDDNSINLMFQNNRKNSYLYNLNFGMGFNRSGRSLRQLVNDGGPESPYEAVNKLNTRFNRLYLANHFEKTLPADRGSLLANVTLSRYNSRYRSGYMEFEPVYTAYPSVDVASAYRSRYDAVLAEVQYAGPQKAWGQLSASAYNTYQHSRYTDTGTAIRENSNDFGISAQYDGWRGKFMYTAMMGLQGMHVGATELGRDYDLWIPTPDLTLYYIPSRSLWFRLNYTYTGSLPSISQLSETDQWLDTRLIFHGNSALRPYRTHKVTLFASLLTKYLTGGVSLGYTSSPGMICNHFSERDGYMLESIINLDTYTVVYGQVDVTIKPLGNNMLTLFSRVNLGRVRGTSEEYDWKGYRFQWMSVASVNLDRWTIQAYYQYPGKVADGQLIRPRAEVWSLTALFRPMLSLSVGVEWEMPFGRKFRESEHTVATSPVATSRVTDIRDRANMLSLKLSWNLSFGRNRNQARPSFSKDVQDTGILTK